jgi:hypothetical protein
MAGVEIAPSTYYATKTRPLSARAVRDAELVEDIKVVHKANLGLYGVRKVQAAPEPGRDQRGVLHGRAVDASRGPAGHQRREGPQDHDR